MMLAVLFALTTACVAVESQSVLATVTSGCNYQGKWVPEGSFQADPCSPCHCHQGQVACAIVDCMVPMCVDAVQKADQCCPVCPNGNNCRAPDGQVIQAGEHVEINADTTCTCDNRMGFGFMSNAQALCMTKLQVQTLATAVALS